MFSLNLSDDNRILSACVYLDGVENTNVVDKLPDGDISDYKYINGEYVYEPLQEQESHESQPTFEEDIQMLMVDHEYRLTLLELGITE